MPEWLKQNDEDRTGTEVIWDRLSSQSVEQEYRNGELLDRRVYCCSSCAGCLLRASCTDRMRNRRLRSNGKNPLREAMTKKVQSEAGR